VACRPWHQPLWTGAGEPATSMVAERPPSTVAAEQLPWRAAVGRADEPLQPTRALLAAAPVLWPPAVQAGVASRRKAAAPEPWRAELRVVPAP
jgi:hypothetical protein